MKTQSLILCGIISLLFISNAGADVADMSAVMDMLGKFQKQMDNMQKTIDLQNQKIAQLEGRAPAINIPAPAASEAAGTPSMSDNEFNERLGGALGGANKWLKNLNFKGDLRLRYDALQNASGAVTETDDRNRFRYRLRYGLEKKFSDFLNAGFSFASGEFPVINGSTAGSSAAIQNDPSSTNTTLDNNFNYKPIYIDKVYVNYSPGFLKKGPVEKVTVTGGKMDNAFEKGSSELVWDRDVKPEGLIEKIDFNLMESDDFDLKAFITGGQFILDEDSDASVFAGDSELFAVQAGINPVMETSIFSEPIDFLSAVSYFSYNDYANNNNFNVGGGSGSLARGNSNVIGSSTDLDAADFEVLEVYNELSLSPAGFPVKPFVDWAGNLNSALNEDSDAFGSVGTGENSAWALGIKFGSLAKKGDWELSYSYRFIGADAVPGFNDSDFGNSGHSGKRGNALKAGYAITDYMSINLGAYFVSNLNAGSTIIDEQQRRFQVDLGWKF